MENFGFFRACACIPSVELANPDFNISQIIEMARKANDQKCRLVVFPELSVTGYTCADLFNQEILLASAIQATGKLIEESQKWDCAVVVGMPIVNGNHLFNCAVVIYQGTILGIVPKSYLPNYNEFYEKRWFASGLGLTGLSSTIFGYEVPFGSDQIFEIEGVKFGVEICEDMWVPDSPGTRFALAGADIICNLSATDELIGKHNYLVNLLKNRSAVSRCGYIYASAGWGESSTDLVFSGNAIIAEDGVILKEGKRFQLEPQMSISDIDIEKLRNDRRRFGSYADPASSNSELAKSYRIVSAINNGNRNTISTGTSETQSDLLVRYIDPHPFVPSDPMHLHDHCEEIISIQSWGLARRLSTVRSPKMVIGISGGLDSTLALLVAVRALDMTHQSHSEITAITMPGFGTTSRTHGNAWKLMEQLGVTPLEIPIGEAVELHFKAIGQDPQKHDATYENSQARERTQILMDMANKVGGIVVGTGDLSELALGWCTYNGDQMSMYGVNTSIPKTLVKYLVDWFAKEAKANGKEEIASTLWDIIDTPISPELIPAADNKDTIEQKTEDLVGPYELHDFFLFHTLRNGFSPEKIEMMALIAFRNRYEEATIRKWLDNFYRRFFTQQFKRSCMPDGPKVGSVCLSPRGDWRMPSDASSAIWRGKI